MTFARIAGTGSYLPPQVVTNQDLEARLDTTAQWIRERTGIERRHVVEASQTTSDLAVAAAEVALGAAGVSSTDLDLIVVATTTPDHIFPSVATQVQDRLGCAGFAAFDIQAVCTGFIYALDVADKFIRTGSARCALVIGAETFTRILDWSDRSTCVLFGDGAGAVVLTASDTPGILSSHLHADGRHKELLWVPGGVSRGIAEEPHQRPFVAMRGGEVFRMAVNTLGQLVEDTLAANGLTPAQLDWLVPHQANARILQATAKRLGLPLSRVIDTIKDHGNTSAASVPLALDTAVRDGRIQPGHTLLLEAFGGGFTWGSVLAKF
ncbi:MAG: beta-ketoacyl-ACP synthase III [Candidatus Competibacterales bacterium]